MNKKNRFNLPTEGLTEKQKESLINKASVYYGKYMDILMPGWQEDPNSIDTPRRVTKAFINDIGKGLYTAPPKITAFDNVENYSGIVLEANIPVQSLCSHHHQNIFGEAHVAYIPSATGKIIGLSKLNRIVEYYSRTPQVQENLTQQIHDSINELCEGNRGVAVIIKAKHMCVGHRGINQNSDMCTAILTGDFGDIDKVRNEFYKLVELSTK